MGHDGEGVAVVRTVETSLRDTLTVTCITDTYAVHGITVSACTDAGLVTTSTDIYVDFFMSHLAGQLPLQYPSKDQEAIQETSLLEEP